MKSKQEDLVDSYPNQALMVFHGVYQADGSVTHYDYSFPPEAYSQLPYLYLVHVAERVDDNVRVLGFFFLKTNFLRDNPDFNESILAASQCIDSFKHLNLSSNSLWTSKLELESNDAPPCEQKMLLLAHENYMKIDSRGRA